MCFQHSTITVHIEECRQLLFIAFIQTMAVTTSFCLFSFCLQLFQIAPNKSFHGFSRIDLQGVIDIHVCITDQSKRKWFIIQILSDIGSFRLHDDTYIDIFLSEFLNSFLQAVHIISAYRTADITQYHKHGLFPIHDITDGGIPCKCFCHLKIRKQITTFQSCHLFFILTFHL